MGVRFNNIPNKNALAKKKPTEQKYNIFRGECMCFATGKNRLAF